MSQGEPTGGANVPREIGEREPKIKKLSISDFARAIGLEPDTQGRFTFLPEHIRLAYEYAERFARDKERDKEAESIVVDGVASPAVIASLLHGAHPAEGYLTYTWKDAEGGMAKGEIRVLEPLPKGEGSGPEGFTWAKTDGPDYTLVEFMLSGDFKVEDLGKVIPPEVDPTKPVIISGRGPTYLAQTIAAGYRHYKGIPGVGFYQPASKFGPAKTEIGISHTAELPLGLNFGEPKEIGAAKKKYQEQLAHNKAVLSDAINNNLVRAEMVGEDLYLRLEGGPVFSVPRLEIVEP